MKGNPEYRLAVQAHNMANYLNIDFGAAWQVSHCMNKTRWSEESEAKAKAELWGQRVYECPICGGYHCSSKEMDE